MTSRRTLALSGAVVVALGLVVPVLGGTPLSSAAARVVRLPGNRGESVVLFVGDSVPQRLLPELSAAAKERGLTLVTATAGGCSPLGVHTEISPGETTGRDCAEKVPGRIDAALQTYQPKIVVWWSRYELADRYDAGVLLRAGTPGFWSAQRRDLDARLGTILAGDARVVFVETDRVGIGVTSLCTQGGCHPFLDRLAHHDAIRREWNTILAERVRADPRTRLVRIDDVYCHDARVPCDDRSRTGRTVRSDGSHFSDPAMKVTVADAVLDRVVAALAR